MAQKTGAGPLREVLIAQSREEIDDGYGNLEGVWVGTQKHPAAVEARRGGEAVIAGRLQGVATYIVTARYSAAAAAITPGWRFVDARSGAVYSIRTAIHRPRRDYIDFDVEIGVADG